MYNPDIYFSAVTFLQYNYFSAVWLLFKGNFNDFLEVSEY